MFHKKSVYNWNTDFVTKTVSTQTTGKDLQMFEKIKRILALIGAILLAALYLITLILAFADPTASRDWLKAAVCATIIVPIVLYGYILVYRLLKKKNGDE